MQSYPVGMIKAYRSLGDPEMDPHLPYLPIHKYGNPQTLNMAPEAPAGLQQTQGSLRSYGELGAS